MIEVVPQIFDIFKGNLREILGLGSLGHIFQPMWDLGRRSAGVIFTTNIGWVSSTWIHNVTARGNDSSAVNVLGPYEGGLSQIEPSPIFHWWVDVQDTSPQNSLEHKSYFRSYIALCCIFGSEISNFSPMPIPV